MSDHQINREYQKLRKQIFRINDLVVKQLQKYQKNVQKKRMNTQFETQRVNEVRERQIQNNISIIERMKKQYKGLKTKSQTITSKQDLERQIQETKIKINNMKKKINTIKLKNKDIGDSIIGTDQVLIWLQQSQRQLETWQRKKNQLQTKQQKVFTQQQQISSNLSKLTPVFNQVDQFVKNQQTQKKNVQINKKISQTYKQKLNAIQILKRNMQVWTGIKQHKYHQLLKQIESFSGKETEIQGRINEVSLDTISSVDEIRNLQVELKIIKQEKSRFSQYQKTIEDKVVEKSLNSLGHKSISSSNGRRNIKLNLVNFRQQKNAPTKRFIRKQQHTKSLIVSSIQNEKQIANNKINIQTDKSQRNKKQKLKQLQNNYDFSTEPIVQNIAQKIKPLLLNEKSKIQSNYQHQQNSSGNINIKPTSKVQQKMQPIKNDNKIKHNENINQNPIFDQIQFNSI